jgi:hypothetical protein
MFVAHPVRAFAGVRLTLQDRARSALRSVATSMSQFSLESRFALTTTLEASALGATAPSLRRPSWFVATTSLRIPRHSV